jgi:hypothetical protein
MSNGRLSQADTRPCTVPSSPTKREAGVRRKRALRVGEATPDKALDGERNADNLTTQPTPTTYIDSLDLTKASKPRRGRRSPVEAFADRCTVAPIPRGHPPPPTPESAPGEYLALSSEITPSRSQDAPRETSGDRSERICQVPVPALHPGSGTFVTAPREYE